MTIAIMLGLLIAPFLILTGLERVLPRAAIVAPLRGRIGLALVFLFTATGHFIRTEPMVEMLPPLVPARMTIVQVTGALEFAAALGLLVSRPAVVRMTGICLIISWWQFSRTMSRPRSPGPASGATAWARGFC